MKSRSIVFALSLVLSFYSNTHAQDDAQLRQLAKRLVQSASVKPGDVVVITGGKHMVPLMEDVAVEVQIAGGFANMWLFTDKVQRAILMDEPEQYLGQKATFVRTWYSKVNVLITLPSIEDSTKLYDGVPQVRVAKANAPDDDIAKQLTTLPMRWISLPVPNPAYAKIVGVDFSEMQKMTLDGINADYTAISAEGVRLKSLFRSAKQVHVTNPDGTDFTFSMAPGRVIEVDDGIITAEEAKSPLLMERADSLPAGLITFAPLENSANGRVVTPKDYGKNGMIRDTKFEFRNGEVVNYTAATNANTFPEDIQPFSGAKNVISSFTIGLNPAMKPMDTGDQNWYPAQAAGLVGVGIGNNQLYGGTNQTNYTGWGWVIPNATVTVDGKLIVKDGKLTF